MHPLRWDVLDFMIVAWFAAVALLPPATTCATEPPQTQPQARVVIENAHPWLPPFGLDRVGHGPDAVVELLQAPRPAFKYILVAYLRGKELYRKQLSFAAKPPYLCRVSLKSWPTELVVITQGANGKAMELVRKACTPPAFEAAAVARPETVINPVDLGAILPPSDWLLLAAGQKGKIEVAAVRRSEDTTSARVTAWFESAVEEKTTAKLTLPRDRPARVRLPLPQPFSKADRDVLHVSIDSPDGKSLKHEKIQTMRANRLPKWPRFGAVETKLRYDAPVSVRSDNGTYSTTSYQTLWKPELQDVVVALPNGSRYVFWRGSSYVPFWAGRYNTGLSYEWAETDPPKDGYTDCVEPLMDKELRYGRVRIMESTRARVHVRWSYQSCDFKYKVWGDSTVEDYYFYPDGFGTRVLTLQSRPEGDYELSEFIILTPQSTYPFSILPRDLVDIIFLDGKKREIDFPFLHGEQGAKAKSRDMPAVYRVRLNNHEPLSAVYFNPLQRNLPPTFFPPFSDKGQLVTPTYWGSHWPLGQGKTTGWAIDDRIGHTPCHCSVMSWARSRPEPLRTARVQTIDTLGSSKPMLLQTWTWLIGMSRADDGRLLEWARSYANPPSLELQAARLEAPSYLPERRAIHLVVEGKTVTIKIKPQTVCVNPVFELDGSQGKLKEAYLNNIALGPKQYAWDGKTFWLDTTLTKEATLRLQFEE
ncbi:MAG: hypothetical protein JXM70_17190 [Pirellulales bacterium]|nr:hypothetical protein [Pirellulales bacterium]